MLGDDFTSYGEITPAMWKDDTKVRMSHLFSWRRIAMVRDHDYRRMVQGFGFLIPAEVKVFPSAELDAAKEWSPAQQPARKRLGSPR